MPEGYDNKMRKDKEVNTKVKKTMVNEKKIIKEKTPIEVKEELVKNDAIEEISKVVENKEVKKVVQSKVTPKDKAIVNGYSLRISPKYSKYVCKMITNKTIEKAKELLENVIKRKQPVKMTGLEVPHQKGKGIAGAKFPVSTSKEILLLVKQLESNCIVNQIENPIIKIAMPNKASSPKKKGGRTSKRTHVYLEAISRSKLRKKKK